MFWVSTTKSEELFKNIAADSSAFKFAQINTKQLQFSTNARFRKPVATPAHRTSSFAAVPISLSTGPAAVVFVVVVVVVVVVGVSFVVVVVVEAAAAACFVVVAFVVDAFAAVASAAIVARRRARSQHYQTARLVSVLALDVLWRV